MLGLDSLQQLKNEHEIKAIEKKEAINNKIAMDLYKILVNTDVKEEVRIEK